MEDKILTFLESIDSRLIEINAHLVFICQCIEDATKHNNGGQVHEAEK